MRTKEVLPVNLQMVVIPQQTLDDLVSEVRQVKELLTNQKVADACTEWIEASEAHKMLGVSPKTFKRYTERKKIAFSQIGRKVYIKRAELNAWIESNNIEKR